MADLNHHPEPKIIRPFSDELLKEIQEHVAHIRRAFDAPGAPYHDANDPVDHRFNRWFWHNLPFLRTLHHDPEFIAKISALFGQPVKPSYCFLSMYGPDGVCPAHTDRPQCQFTVDLLVHADGKWPIYIEDKAYVAEPGDAVCYSGTGQRHYRKPMREDSDVTRMDLVFFHFVPTNWVGSLE